MSLDLNKAKLVLVLEHKQDLCLTCPYKSDGNVTILGHQQMLGNTGNKR